jgi:hypothetical protein
MDAKPCKAATIERVINDFLTSLTGNINAAKATTRCFGWTRFELQA